jgi:hypothetical protein
LRLIAKQPLALEDRVIDSQKPAGVGKLEDSSNLILEANGRKT